jgi:hypothetical protein
MRLVSQSLRSKRGVLGAALVLLALPLAFALSVPLGYGETILHFLLGAGVILVASSVFDFRTTRWLAWLGCLGLGGFGAILLLQGVSDLASSESLHDFAYDGVGQVPERVLPDLFIAWCFALLLQDSNGKTRLYGAAVVGLVAVVELVDYGMSAAGAEAPGILKALYLLPFVWLLLESLKPVATASEREPVAGHDGLLAPIAP